VYSIFSLEKIENINFKYLLFERLWYDWMIYKITGSCGGKYTWFVEGRDMKQMADLRKIVLDEKYSNIVMKSIDADEIEIIDEGDDYFYLVVEDRFYVNETYIKYFKGSDDGVRGAVEKYKRPKSTVSLNKINLINLLELDFDGFVKSVGDQKERLKAINNKKRKLTRELSKIDDEMARVKAMKKSISFDEENATKVVRRASSEGRHEPTIICSCCNQKLGHGESHESEGSMGGTGIYWCKR